MSIGHQFKRIGEIVSALGLWAIVIWIFSKPKRILLLLLVVFTLIITVSIMSDETGDVFYVNTNTLELLDKPFGKVVKTLSLNDSLILIKEMSDNWVVVAVETDTLYFKDQTYFNENMDFIYRIDKTPFTKWKALEGQEVILNHPDGFFEAGGTMMRNGDIIKVLYCYEYSGKIKFKNGGGSFTEIPIDFVKINWNNIFKKYPKLKDNNK
jgi:hypothetical protein